MYLRLVKRSIFLLVSCIFSIFWADQIVCLILLSDVIVCGSKVCKLLCDSGEIDVLASFAILVSMLLVSWSVGRKEVVSLLSNLFIIFSAEWRCVAFKKKA